MNIDFEPKDSQAVKLENGGYVSVNTQWPPGIFPGEGWSNPHVSGQITISSTLKENLMEINKAENGFLVTYNTKTYVFESLDTLCNFIKDKLNGQKT